jgi:two-component system NarL family sensor kinase
MDIDTAGGNKELSAAMGAILQKIRETSYLLHPPLLDEAGLRAALHWYVDGLMQRSKLQISLVFHPDLLPGVPKEIEMTIFRIIQEALGNVFRHAQSESARVEIVGQSEQIIVRVRDYGKGISPRIAAMEASAKLGVGISGMRERVRQLGGELSIKRAEPGTLVEATIPLSGKDLIPG